MIVFLLDQDNLCREGNLWCLVSVTRGWGKVLALHDKDLR